MKRQKIQSTIFTCSENPDFQLTLESSEKEFIVGETDTPITEEVTTNLVLKIRDREITLPISGETIHQLYCFFHDLNYEACVMSTSEAAKIAESTYQQLLLNQQKAKAAATQTDTSLAEDGFPI